MPSVAGSNVPDVSTLPVASSSTTVDGGIRPPVPITVGGGTGRVPRVVMVGEASSVVVRLAELVPPGRNSDTVPLTAISVPTDTVGAVEVKTNRASEVAGSL